MSSTYTIKKTHFPSGVIRGGGGDGPIELG